MTGDEIRKELARKLDGDIVATSGPRGAKMVRVYKNHALLRSFEGIAANNDKEALQIALAEVEERP